MCLRWAGTETTPCPVRISTTPKCTYCINGWICRTRKRPTRTRNTCRECWFFSTVRFNDFVQIVVSYRIVFFINNSVAESKIFVHNNISRVVRLSGFKWLWLFLMLCFVASTAFVFCICTANLDYCDGLFQYAIMFVIGVSAVILVIIMLMLYRLPQAIENLSFKVKLYTQ